MIEVRRGCERRDQISNLIVERLVTVINSVMCRRKALDPLLASPHHMADNVLKRARLSRGSRRDILPLPDDNHSLPIQSIEAKLTRVAGTLRQGPLVRTPIDTPSSSTWANLQQWEPIDSSTYALDPGNSEWYDEALEQDVMDAPRPSAVATRKKYKRSRVSVCPKT